MPTDVQFGNAVYVNAPNSSFVDKHGRTGIVTKNADLIWVRMDKSGETHTIEPEFVQRIWNMAEPAIYMDEKVIVHQPVIVASEGTVKYHIRYPDPLRGTCYVEHRELSDWVEPEPTPDEMIADLTEQLRQVCVELDEKKEILGKVQSYGNKAMTIIGDRLLQEAEDRNWCNEFDEIIADVNAQLRAATGGRYELQERTVTKTVTLRRRRWVDEELQVEVEVPASYEYDDIVDVAYQEAEYCDWSEYDSEVDSSEVYSIE